MSAPDLSQFSMLDLFRAEAETQTQLLSEGLLALEREPALPAQLEICMRAAHSLKGAARIVGLGAGVRLTHAIEDCFVAAQNNRLTLARSHIDLLLAGTDLLLKIARSPAAEIAVWENDSNPDVQQWQDALARLLTEGAARTSVGPDRPAPITHAAGGPLALQIPELALVGTGEPAPAGGVRDRAGADRAVRVSAENLNRLLSLTGESLVESRWATPFGTSLLQLKRLHHDLATTLDGVLHAASARAAADPSIAGPLADAQQKLGECGRLLADRLAELETFDRRNINLAHRLYDEALACRMRPFADGVVGMPRMVRDLAHSFGREVKLEVVGGTTQVDRDILALLDAPLGHLLRNAVDHGVEPAEVRRAAGKSASATVRLEARHSAGALHVAVSDDGAGIDLDRLRETVVERSLTTREGARALSDDELLQFLFLPGFTLRSTVTDVSGRGVGLDAVHDMVKQVHGTVRVSTRRGQGTQFHVQLPVTLSVARTVLVDIGGEPYAFPLTAIEKTLMLSQEKIAFVEGRQHFEFEGRDIGLVSARQVLGIAAPATSADDLSVIVVGDHTHSYGVVVDRFLGQRELVVQPLDAQLGKIRDIAAGALMEDGSPVLIVDPEDMIRSMDRLAAEGHLTTMGGELSKADVNLRRRVLVVDDSLTVRELERKLLTSKGYDVEVAVDGMDGWNTVRTSPFDLVVTDIDMPRMDGIELVSRIRADPNLTALPVMIVSYKDRDEDRRRGLEAGAAYYLTKGSFHDDSLLLAVVDLIGEPHA